MGSDGDDTCGVESLSATAHIATISPAWRFVDGKIQPVEVIDVKATVVIK